MFWGARVRHLRRCGEAPQGVPISVEAKRGLAARHYYLGDFQVELEVRHLIVGIDPNGAPDWTSLGHTLLALDDLPGARDAYRRALELNPQDEPARFNLGLIEHELGRPGRESPRYHEGDVPRDRDRRDARLWMNSLR